MRPFGSITYNKNPGRKNLLAISNAAAYPPTYPEPSILSFSGGKNDNMPPGNPEGTLNQETTRRESKRARQNPDTQTLVGRPPARVEPNCGALDKLSELRVQ